jgi:hypothetical protein
MRSVCTLSRNCACFKQHYCLLSTITCLTTVITALKCQCRKQALCLVADMSLFGAFKYSKNEVCVYNMSRLCLFQAVVLLAQHCATYLTTVITALKRQCRKRTLFLVADMSHLGALKSSKNEVCLYTISRLCLFQAVLLLAQHYTTCLATVITAPKRQYRKQTICLVADMSLFGVLKTSKNEVCLYTISRLCLFQAVLLLAQRYITYLTAVLTAPKRQCGSRTLCLIADMSLFGALKSSKNEVCVYNMSRLCVFQAVLLLAQHNTTYLTIVITVPKRQCRNQTQFVLQTCHILVL